MYHFPSLLSILRLPTTHNRLVTGQCKDTEHNCVYFVPVSVSHLVVSRGHVGTCVMLLLVTSYTQTVTLSPLQSDTSLGKHDQDLGSPPPPPSPVCGCLGPMCSNVLSLSSYYLYLEHFLFTLFKKLVRIWTNEITCNLYQLLFHCVFVCQSTVKH